MMPALGWKNKLVPSSHTKVPGPDVRPPREEARRPQGCSENEDSVLWLYLL